MGYLAVMAGTFVASLVVTASLLSLVSAALFGSVQDWVLIGSLVLACCASWRATQLYEDAHRPWPGCR